MTEKIPQPDADNAAETTVMRKGVPSLAAHGADQSKKPRAQNTQDSSYQNYLFGSSGSSENPAWSDTAKGRFLIRLVSRGIVGATFFVVGGRLAAQHMNGYNRDTWSWQSVKESGKWLQVIAHGIDSTLGKGIEKTVGAFARIKHDPVTAARIGRQAVTFRESRNFRGAAMDMGRSYGSDIVSFTFDFAMASVGDASTRTIIQAFDPNIKKTWKVNDEGKPAAKGENWHFVPGEWLKAFGKASWRILSKNQGEDWAAAIPYAFQMKFQRQFLSNVMSKRWDGHQLVFDHSWNGGAYRLNQQGKIVGDYQMAGAIDLHARFVGYNWYTLMFREGYDAIGNAYHKWKDDGFAIHAPHLSESNPIVAAVDTVGHAARYVAKSFIKANIYMNPAVIPFWLTRVPQSKWRGRDYVEGSPAHFGADTNIWKSPDQLRAGETSLKPFSWKNYEHYPTATKMDKFEKGFSMFLNPFGWASFNLGKGFANLGDKVVSKDWQPKSQFLTNLITDKKNGFYNGRRKFMHEIVDASVSYTPYMWAKAETALRVDDNKGDGKLGQMDVAIYKFIDDVAGLKFTSVPEDIKKMWKLGTNFEREVKAREGVEPGTQEIVKNMAPKTSVHAQTVTKDPVSAVRAANEPDAVNDPVFDHSWVKSVMGSDINPARIHAGTATRH